MRNKKFNPKALPLADYGNGSTEFVDDLARIEEFGSVTHLTFAMTQNINATSPDDRQRMVTLRLIIPTEARIAMARQLMAGQTDPAVRPSDDHIAIH